MALAYTGVSAMQGGWFMLWVLLQRMQPAAQVQAAGELLQHAWDAGVSWEDLVLDL